MKPVTLPPGRARLSTKPAPTGSRRPRTRSARCVSPAAARPRPRLPCGQDHVGRERDQFRRVSANVGRHRRWPSACRSARCGRGPAQLRQPLQERPEAGLKFRIVRGCGQEHADAPHPLGLLRAHRERPVAAAPPSSVMNSRRFIRSPRRRARAASAARRGRAPWRS